MKDILLAIEAEYQKGAASVLAVIVGGKGSSPRKTGAMMLCGAAGRICGTIGGGISEHLACEEAKKLLREKKSAVREYVLHPSEKADIGARCGGEVSVYLRYIGAEKDGPAPVFSGALSSYSENAAWLVFDMNEQSASRAGIIHLDKNGVPYLAVSNSQSFPAPGDLIKPRAAIIQDADTAFFSTPVFSPGFVYIAGGGHIARELCPLLTRLGFRCVIFESRGEFANPRLFPDAARLVCGSYDSMADLLSITHYDYIVAITSGHTGDFKTAAFALKTPARYIGIIGSKQKLAFVRERLLNTGFSEAQINAPRVHAPIGVAIKSETPEEVAVSIAAELIQVRSESIDVTA